MTTNTKNLAATALLLVCAIGVNSSLAAGPITSTPASGQKAAAEASEVTALRPAFNTLLQADHDYQGHRAKAMRAIAAACRLMGTDIVPPSMEGRGRGAGAGPKHATTEPEQQTTSDTQLHQVQATVQQVLDSIPAGAQPKVTEHLKEAVNEIGIALTVK